MKSWRNSNSSSPSTLKLLIPAGVILCFAFSFRPPDLHSNALGQTHNRQTPRIIAELSMREAATLRSNGVLLQERGDRQGALRYLKEALLASRKARDVHEETRVLNALGYLQTLLGNYNEALTLLSRAIELSTRHNNRQNEAQTLSNMGETYHDMGQLPQALEHEQKSLQLWIELNDKQGQAQALLRTGYTRMSMGQ